ncbi:HPr kinase/phosphorylase [Asticcacaulis taihuensis]|jgi:serine kinase of HPr protein (carbohydrate metabolism regulator)|uniref:HPr Serine kinase C-terminal domain-containing protein n=1 Tax=Asticcacaulis taihuensis TaxID=260084 RepID=A0A1G4SQ91_9CAUL|nr:HPr kinase/phosphatase C-terminal domain-containing protein [Asticcacaulis taihuensis]SCW71394.1 HPr Serine kinase C-terminal domain-containing protein [Asticcacaulis taihuensis]
MSKLIIHATSLSLHIGQAWRGVLIMGPSGSGKSDLALRLIEAAGYTGCALVSDDYSVLWTSGGQLYAGAPETIEGRMEIRGLGIMTAETRKMTRIHLAVLAQSDPIERLPENEITPILGQAIPTIRLNPREASSVSKLLHRLKIA